MSKTKAKNQTQPALPLSASAPVVSVAPIKRYDENFRKHAVEHWIKTGKAGTQIAAELGISYPSLKEWKRRYQGDAMPEHGNLELENRTLRAELARVREQRDILKKRWVSSPNRRRALPNHPNHEHRTRRDRSVRRL